MYKLIVVKIGASILVGEKHLNLNKFKEIAYEVSKFINRGTKVIIVSSGAIASAMSKLNIQSRPKILSELQALASLGQIELMKLYQKYFSKYNFEVGQVLLTWDDFSFRIRYLNAQKTLLKLLNLGIVPIINENDTVAVEEIKLGDNDRLSAMVASMVGADLLLMLTDVDGIYDSSGNLIKETDDIKKIKEYCLGTDKQFCIGGMITKLEAAEIATYFGIPCLISNGRIRFPISKAIERNFGSYIKPHRKLKARKHWLAYLSKPKGAIVIDSGARQAIVKKYKSILPKGILSIRGDFDAGELIKILDQDELEIARGITNYSCREIDKIKGQNSSEIKAILGYKRSDEVISRDNLVVIGGEE